MSNAPKLIALGLMSVLAACSKSQNPDKSTRRTLPSNFVEGSFVVTADVTTSESQLKARAAAAGAARGCALANPDRINWGDEALDASGVLSQQMLNTFSLRYSGCDLSKEGTKALIDGLASESLILSAEAEAIAVASPITEDDGLKTYEDHLALIKRDQACALADKSGEPVIVAVVDTGVDTTHPDLKDVILHDATGQIVGANFVGSGAQMPPDDLYNDQAGHGTHVAGLIGAAANNGRGVVGVGACANVKIMPVRVLGANGKGNSIEIERGVKWAADHGAQIINLSLGFTGNLYGSSRNFYRSLYAELAQRDIVVFAASGNDGYENGTEDPDAPGAVRFGFPASYDNVISVAATDSHGKLAYFSNRGPRVDIAAPGYAVLSTLMGGSYGRMSGTSMATPVAAGSYALALATARQGLGALDRIDAKDAEEFIRTAIVASAALPESEVAAGGVIDVEKLVSAIKAKYPKPVPPPAPTTPTTPTTPSAPPPSATTPSAPVETIIEPEAPVVTLPFGFAGLKSGDQPSWPQAIGVENLPVGTTSVYFYWGTATWSFSKASVKNGESAVSLESKWYFYGNRTLRAVAYGKAGKLGTVSIELKAY